MALNTRDQAKWDRLQDEGGASLNNIVAGKGSPQDIERVASVLREQHALAGQLFDQRVQEAEQTADTIVDRLNKERVDAGKRALSQGAHDRIFQSTFKKVMSESIEDILQMVHDDLESESATIRDSIADSMNRLRQSVVRQVEQRPDEIPGNAQPNRSPLDRLLERNQPTPTEGPEAQRNRSLLDRVLRRNQQSEEQRTSLLQVVRESVGSAKDKVASLFTRFRRRDNEDDEDRKASIWIRKLKAVFDPIRNKYRRAKQVGSKIGDILGSIGKPLMLALMNPDLIRNITDSVSKYLNFDNISKFMTDMWESAKKMGSDSIDWIIDKVKAFFGLGGKSKTEVKPAAAKPAEVKPAITTPQELPKSVSAAQASTELPKMQQGLEQAQRMFTDAQARYKANPNEANKKALQDAQTNLTYWQNRVAIYQKRANETKLAGSDVAQAASVVAPPKAATSDIAKPGEVQASATASDAAPAVSATTTAANPQAVMNSSSAAAPKTTVQAEMPQFTPGKAYVPPETKADEKTAEAQSAAARAQIGIGSFGFDSNDSSLNVLNLGMLS